MDALVKHLEAFIAAIKDDPSLTEAFRLAANELHDHLASAGTKPSGRSKPKPAAEPVEG